MTPKRMELARLVAEVMQDCESPDEAVELVGQTVLGAIAGFCDPCIAARVSENLVDYMGHLVMAEYYSEVN